MGVSEDWQEIKYKETFDEEVRGMERRIQSNTSCKIEDFEEILKNLYIMDGAFHDGRGSLANTILSARIAAYEFFIAELKAKLP